jgi:hypothetical protein
MDDCFACAGIADNSAATVRLLCTAMMLKVTVPTPPFVGTRGNTSAFAVMALPAVT